MVSLMLTAGLCAGVQAQAQDEEAQPVALNMTAVDLVFEADPKHTEEFHKYFFFHKDGVSFDQARDEIGECNVYQTGPAGAEGETFLIVPRFVSLSETQSYKPYVYNSNDGGVVGAIIGDIISASILKKNKAQRWRRCMEFKGYDRYGLSKDLWKTISKVGDDQYIQIHANIASGPKPQAEKLLP